MRKEHKTILIAMPNKGTKGGPQGHLPYLVESLEQKGHKLIQVSYGQKKDNENIFWKAISNIVSIRRLRQILKNNSDIDIIHINSAFDTKALIRDTLTVIFILKYSKPIFIKFHGSDKNLTETKNYILRFLQNKLYKFIDGMGVLSSEERKNFIKAGVDVSKIFIVKNIVKPELYKKNDGSLNENNFNYHNIILYISRFIENKGLLDVIEACKLLKEIIGIYILCLGDGPIRKSAENNVRMYGLEGKVKFLGYIPEEETHEYYSNSDFIVFPTYHQEGFPMANIPFISRRITYYYN
jgi:Glycosyltransferase